MLALTGLAAQRQRLQRERESDRARESKEERGWAGLPSDKYINSVRQGDREKSIHNLHI